MTFLRLLWTVRGLCQRWRQREMGETQIETGNREKNMLSWHWRGYIYTPARANLSDLPSSHICSSRHLLELQPGETWRRGAVSFTPLPSRQAGRKRQRETLHITSSVSGSCSVWTMSLCPRCRPSQRRDSEWNMEGGKSLSGICQLNVSLWWMGSLDVATMDCANRGSPSTWWHYCSVLFNKDRATTELQ